MTYGPQLGNQNGKYSDIVSLHVGRHGDRDKRPVVAIVGGKEHRSKIDTDEAWQREKFRQPVVSMMVDVAPYQPDGYTHFEAAAHAWLDGEIVRLADIEDAKADEPLNTPIVVCMSDVEPKEIKWYWQNRIPAGRISLFVGRPGEGKSFATIYLAANTTTGTPFPDGAACEKGSVLLMTAEDDPADTIRPRLDAHHADCSKVHMLAAVRTLTAEGDQERLISLADVDAIEATLKKLTDCRLVVVDPIGSFLGGKVDAHRDNEVRSRLAPIAMLAEKYGPAVVVVAHRRKAQGSTADDLALGSRAFTGIARAVWHVSTDAKDKNRRLFLPGKNNLAARGSGLAFTICGQPVGRVQWEREAVDMSADDSLAAEMAASKPGPKAEALGEAIDFLAKRLAGGPVLTTDVEAEARAHAISQSTLRRARKELKVKAVRLVARGPWHLVLPGKAFTLERLTELEHLEHLEHVTESPGNKGCIKSYGVLGAQDAQDTESGDDDDPPWGAKL